MLQVDGDRFDFRRATFEVDEHVTSVTLRTDDAECSEWQVRDVCLDACVLC